MRKALLVVLAVGCAGRSDGLSLADYRQAFIEALCEHQVSCGEFPDVDTCVSARNIFSPDLPASFEAAVAAGKVVYHTGKARECVDAIANATCDKTDADLRDLTPRPCFETTTGTLHDGDTCALGIECISQSCNAPPCQDACCTGACIGDSPPLFDLPIGAMCDPQLVTNECTVNASCDGTTHVCGRLKPEGATCNGGGECDFGLGCAGSPPICKQLPTLGEACPDGACRDEGQICNGTCVKAGLAGDPCLSDIDCANAYKCDASGACVGGSGEGGPCSRDSDCWGPDFCNFFANAGSMCTAFKLDGETCGGNTQCASGHCNDTGTCDTPGACI